MAKGIIYCLTNPAMPDLVKIGLVETDNIGALKQRMSTLYSTGVPFPFELFYAVRVDRPEDKERLLHDTFNNARKNSRREFFEIEPERVVSAMKLTGGEEVSITDIDPAISVDIEAGNREREKIDKKKSNFNFSAVGIPIGAELTFSRDPNRVAKVISDKKIELDGEEMMLSGAALKILKEQGVQWERANGTLFWEYEGRILDEIRKQKDEEEYNGE
ncbi:MAG: GIY-YIG nuclease family protein [Gammaproteobacteria bacterium]